MPLNPHPRVLRNLRALALVASILFAITFLTGALFLYLGINSPHLQKPVREFGEYVLIIAALNGLVFAGVYSQIHSWRRSIDEKEG
jgi:hypothetical protein